MKIVGLTSAFAVVLVTVALADHVNPVVYGDEEGEENNPSCAYLDPSWNEVKVNQAPNGDHADSGGGDNPGGDGPLVFTVKNSDGEVFDWESNIGVDAVVVKGGNRGSNVYFYSPEHTSDERLRSPDNSQGKTPAISHISACYDTEREDEQPGAQGDGEPPQEQEKPEEDQPEQEKPQEDGQTDDKPRDDGGNERRAGDDEPAEEDEGTGDGGDDGTRNERPADEDEPQQDGGTEDTGGDGDTEVQGVSETEEGDTDDVAEETGSGDSGSDDDLPFTGAPLGVLLLVGLVSILAGLGGRGLTRR